MARVAAGRRARPPTQHVHQGAAPRTTIGRLSLSAAERWPSKSGRKTSNSMDEVKTVIKHEFSDIAKKLVCGDRNLDYGSPLKDYQRTAAVWSGYLIHKLKPGEVITPLEAILMMAALKISREFTKHKDDNIVDSHGYLECHEWAYKELKMLEEVVSKVLSDQKTNQ
jgi:hypothetical protein